MAPRIDSELVRERNPRRSESFGQLPGHLHLVQELLGADRCRREDDLLRGDRLRRGRGRTLGLGEPQVDLVAAVGARGDPGDRRQRHHLRALLLGEVEVVLHQGVLGVVLAADHAVTAGDAGVAVGTDATEERVRHPLPSAGVRLTEEHAHRCRVEGVADAEVVGDLLHHVVRRRAQGVLDHAEHPLRLVVVRRQLGLPVGDVAPLGVLVEGLERFVERVRVDQRAATDTRPRHDQGVAHGLDALDAVEPERRVGRGTSSGPSRSWRSRRPRTWRRPRSRRRGSPSRPGAGHSPSRRSRTRR